MMVIMNADLRDILKLTRPLVCFDVETHDKCPPERAYIVEMGMKVFYHDDRPTKEWGSLIRPPEWVKVHPAATSVHGITNEQLNEKREDGTFRWPTFAQLARNLAIGFTGVDFCGYNVDFDLRATKAEMDRAGVKWDYDTAFTLDGFKIWRKMATRTLTDAVREHAGREPTEAHRAGADIADTIDAIYGMHTRYGLPPTIAEIHKLCKGDRIDSDGKFGWNGADPIICFGKWNGTKLNDPKLRSYLEWMLRGEFSSETKQIAQDCLDGKYPVKETSDAG